MKSFSHPLKAVLSKISALRHDNSGLMLIEFAYTTPLVLFIVASGTELTNYATAKMNVGQAALQIADNASRMGIDTNKNDSDTSNVITEVNINDVLTGGGLQFDSIGSLYTRGRVILSSIEPDTANVGKSKIGWQRCRGSKVVASSYGNANASNLEGVGPQGRQVSAPANGAVMFVEVVYNYDPFFLDGFIDARELRATAAMTVREDRNLTINNTEGAPVSSCA